MSRRQCLDLRLAVSRHWLSEGWQSSGASAPNAEEPEAQEKGTKQEWEVGSRQGPEASRGQGTHCRSSALTALDTRG